MFDHDMQTLDGFVSRCENGCELLNAVREVDSILQQSATATVRYDEEGSGSGLEGKYSILDEDHNIPHIRFEDSIKELRKKSEVSWVFGVKKSPTNITTSSASFRAYFEVFEGGAKPIESDELDNLQLQLASSPE